MKKYLIYEEADSRNEGLYYRRIRSLEKAIGLEFKVIEKYLIKKVYEEEGNKG